MRLVSVVYNAARASIAAVYYADSKHGAAYDWQIEDGEGNAASFLETCCGDATVNTETSAIIRADLDSFRAGLDEIGRQILEMVAAHKTEREIGKAVGISNVAVHKAHRENAGGAGKPAGCLKRNFSERLATKKISL